MIRRIRGRNLDMGAAGLAVVGLVAAEILGGGIVVVALQERAGAGTSSSSSSSQSRRKLRGEQQRVLKRGAEIVGEA